MKAVDVSQNAVRSHDDLYSQLTATKKYLVIGLLLVLFLGILAALLLVVPALALRRFSRLSSAELYLLISESILHLLKR